MITLHRISTRPTTDVPFYSMTPEFELHLKTTYDDTGKRLGVVVTESVDGLTQTRVGTWIDGDTLHGTLYDDACLAQLTEMHAYNAVNNITLVETTE